MPLIDTLLHVLWCPFLKWSMFNFRCYEKCSWQVLFPSRNVLVSSWILPSPFCMNPGYASWFLNMPIDVPNWWLQHSARAMCERLGSCVRQSHGDAREHHQNVCCMLLSSPERIVNPWFIDWWGYHTARSCICVIPNWLLQLASVWNTRICHHEVATCAKLGCPCRHAFVKVQQHNANAEEIALAACEVSHNIFKVVLLTFKALHGVAPHYLKTLLQSYIPSRSLRSETGHLLIMPKACRKLGCHSFLVAAPKLWNKLPVNIRTTTSIVSFRSALKTHLFKLAYAWLVQYHHFF